MKNEDLYPKPMTKEEFFQLAKNRNRYRVVKPLTGELAYAKIGDTYFSDTLYERGYNMYALVEQGVLELTPDVFQFEKEIVGKNVHSVYTLCPACKTWGINMPLEKTCGDCGYSEGKTYYDAETIDNYLRAMAKEDATEYVDKIVLPKSDVLLPTLEEVRAAITELGKRSTAPDKETPNWMEKDIENGINWALNYVVRRSQGNSN